MHAAPESLEIEPEQESANPTQNFLNDVSGWAWLKSPDRRFGAGIARRPRWSRAQPAAPKAHERGKVSSPRTQGVDLGHRVRGEGTVGLYAHDPRRSRG